MTTLAYFLSFTALFESYVQGLLGLAILIALVGPLLLIAFAVYLLFSTIYHRRLTAKLARRALIIDRLSFYQR